MMRKPLRITLWVLAGLLVAAGIAAALVYRGLQAAPEFYPQALAVDPATQRTASTRMINRTSKLLSDARRAERWQAVFTEEEINGFLAVDFAHNHSDMLPNAMRNPRVQIKPDCLTLAVRHEGTPRTVLSLALTAYLAGREGAARPEDAPAGSANVVAIGFQRLRAGSVPLPMGPVLGAFSQVTQRLAAEWGWEVAWRTKGDTFALITVPKTVGQRTLSVDHVELREGAIVIGGRTR